MTSWLHFCIAYQATNGGASLTNADAFSITVGIFITPRKVALVVFISEYSMIVFQLTCSLYSVVVLPCDPATPYHDSPKNQA